MELIAATALWMAVITAAWAVITGFAGARQDARLARSGARALHAAAVLTALSVVLHLLEERSEMADVPFAVAAALAARGMCTDAGARLLGWAAAVALAAALAVVVVRHDTRERRVRAQTTAGATVLVFALLAALAGYFVAGLASDEGGAGPVGVQVWPGIIARLLYLAGVAAMLVPVALRGIPARRDTALRWTLAALALTAGGLALAAWVRYAHAALPATLDADGTPVGQPWSTTGALWGVPVLLIAAHAFALAGPARREVGWRAQPPIIGARVIALALALVSALAAFLPAVHDWTQAREIGLGMALHPPLIVLAALPAMVAVLAMVVRQLRATMPPARLALLASAGAFGMGLLSLAAGVRDAAALATIAVAAAAAALVACAAATGGLRRRLSAIAASAMLLLVAAALAATSDRPLRIEVEPGRARGIESRGTPWRLTSQGVSQVEEPLYDAAMVGFEVAHPGDSALVAAGERTYRDAHGHAAARVAVPGVVHGLSGDLRLVVLGTREDAALVQAQYHPLAWLAWLLAATVVAALLAAALVDRASPGRGPRAEDMHA